jgi:hypothetical protein
MNAPARCYTVAEAADSLRVSTTTLRALLKVHPYCAKVGRKIIISPPDLAGLYEAMACPSTSSGTKPAGTTGTTVSQRGFCNGDYPKAWRQMAGSNPTKRTAEPLALVRSQK